MKNPINKIKLLGKLKISIIAGIIVFFTIQLQYDDFFNSVFAGLFAFCSIFTPLWIYSIIERWIKDKEQKTKLKKEQLTLEQDQLLLDRDRLNYLISMQRASKEILDDITNDLFKNADDFLKDKKIN